MSSNGHKTEHLRMYVDVTLVRDTKQELNAKALLQQILTQAEYELHLKCKEALKVLNWQATIEELPVVEWRRKVARH